MPPELASAIAPTIQRSPVLEPWYDSAPFCATPACELSFPPALTRVRSAWNRGIDVRDRERVFESWPANCDSKTNNSRSSQSPVFDR